jgi:hypothetical protein
MNLPIALTITMVGFVLIWFGIDNQILYEGICGGILLGGGIVFGWFVQ